jgi:hypothetical protein
MLATVGAWLLGALGANLVVTSCIDLVGVAAVAIADGPDALTVVVQLVFAVVAALLVLAGVAIGLAEIVVAVRVWRGMSWAWIEATVIGAFGLAAAVVGAVHPADATAPALVRAVHGPWWAAAVVAHAVAVGAVLAARPWFGPLRLPTRDAEAPFWLRRDWPP